MVLSVPGQEHAGHFEAAARHKGTVLEVIVHMFRYGAYVAHDIFRLVKYVRVDALEDKMLLSFGIQGNQEGIIDVAVPEFPDVCNLSQWLELLCNCNKIIHGLIPCAKIAAA